MLLILCGQKNTRSYDEWHPQLPKMRRKYEHMKRTTTKRSSIVALAATALTAGTIALVPSGGASAATTTTPTSTSTTVSTPTPTGTGATTDGYGDGV